MSEPITNRPSLREQFPNPPAPILKESGNQLIGNIIADAIQENPTLSQVEPDKLQIAVKNALTEIGTLEELAKKHEQAFRVGQLPWPIETIRKIKTLWVLSGPGYYRQPFKEDRYKDVSWAKYMGRHRLTYAGLLMRKFAEAIAGIPSAALSTGKISPSIPELRTLVATHSPFLLFNGRPDENQDVMAILETDNSIIPPVKVFISGERIDRTVDQVTNLELPPTLKFQAGDEIGIITHAPHLMRFGHMLRYQQNELPFPPGVVIRALPLASPSDGKTAYTEQEIRGLLYYVFITHQASEENYHYKLD